MIDDGGNIDPIVSSSHFLPRSPFPSLARVNADLDRMKSTTYNTSVRLCKRLGDFIYEHAPLSNDTRIASLL